MKKAIGAIYILEVIRNLHNRLNEQKLCDNDNSIKHESLFIIANTIFLVLSMGGAALSGWYTIMYYCYL